MYQAVLNSGWVLSLKINFFSNATKKPPIKTGELYFNQMLSLFRLVLKSLEAALEGGCTGGWFNKTKSQFPACTSVFWGLGKENMKPILFQQVVLFGTIPPCSEGCSREGVADRCFHTLSHVPSGQQSDAEQQRTPVGFWAKWLLFLLMATWPLSPPEGLVLDAHSHPSALMQKGPSYSLPSKSASTAESAPHGLSRMSCMYTPHIALKPFMEQVHPGEHCCPAIHHSFLLPHQPEHLWGGMWFDGTGSTCNDDVMCFGFKMLVSFCSA